MPLAMPRPVPNESNRGSQLNREQHGMSALRRSMSGCRFKEINLLIKSVWPPRKSLIPLTCVCGGLLQLFSPRRGRLFPLLYYLPSLCGGGLLQLFSVLLAFFTSVIPVVSGDASFTATASPVFVVRLCALTLCLNACQVIEFPAQKTRP